MKNTQKTPILRLISPKLRKANSPAAIKNIQYLNVTDKGYYLRHSSFILTTIPGILSVLLRQGLYYCS